MTYTYEKLANFCGFSVEQMNHYIDFIKDNDDIEKDAKRRWAFDHIQKLRSEADGALTFSLCYMKGIEQEDFEKLVNFVSSGYYAAEDRIWREI